MLDCNEKRVVPKKQILADASNEFRCVQQRRRPAPATVPGVGRGECGTKLGAERRHALPCDLGRLATAVCHSVGPEPPAKQPKVERSERAVAGRGLGGGTSPERSPLLEAFLRLAEPLPGRPPAAGTPPAPPSASAGQRRTKNGGKNGDCDGGKRRPAVSNRRGHERKTDGAMKGRKWGHERKEMGPWKEQSGAMEGRGPTASWLAQADLRRFDQCRSFISSISLTTPSKANCRGVCFLKNEESGSRQNLSVRGGAAAKLLQAQLMQQARKFSEGLWLVGDHSLANPLSFIFWQSLPEKV